MYVGDRAQPVDAADQKTIEAIWKAVSGIRYGVVQVVIQDGRIVQIEKTEKIRLA
jgi:hypothetical protein